MGMFSGLFGGGGTAKRAAQAAASKAAEARGQLGKDQEKYDAYYSPYRQAGEQGMKDVTGSTGKTQAQIDALDPKIAALYEQQAGLQPQVNEMYSLSQQQDPIVQDLLGGGQGFQTSPGYQFAVDEGQKAIERSRAAEGTLNQGGTGKELQRYGVGMANQEYQNYLGNQYNALGAVGTQLGGRQTALNAGQNQVNAGVNLLGQDFAQIAAQQGLTNQYQALVNSGLSAADAAAKLGMNTANAQAGLTKGIGETYASGMQANSNALLSQGQGILKLAGAAAGAYLGGPMGAKMGGDMAGSLGQKPSNVQYGSQQLGTTSQPQMQPSYSSSDRFGGLLGGNANNAQAEASRGSTSGYYQAPQQQAPAFNSRYGF